MGRIDKFKTILVKHKKEIRCKYRVREIGIFGSYARGQEKGKSDIDILVDFEEEPGLFKFIELEDYLSQILGVKTDLVMKDVLKPHIGRQILSEVIYI